MKLDLKLNYLNTAIDNGQAIAKPTPDFKRLRDTSHLCLHATQAFLEETVGEEETKDLDLKSLSSNLSRVFEWFHHAYNASQRQDSTQETASGF